MLFGSCFGYFHVTGGLMAANEVGPDYGDYAYTTVPNQVHRLFKAQQLHDKKHYHARRQMTPEQRAKTPYIDYMRPIVADADTGHGGMGTVMKLAKLFAESVSLLITSPYSRVYLLFI